MGHEEWFRYILQMAAEKFRPVAHLPLDELKVKYQTEIKKIVEKLEASKTPICTTLAVDDIVVKKLFHADRLASGPTSQYLPFALCLAKFRHQVIC